MDQLKQEFGSRWAFNGNINVQVLETNDRDWSASTATIRFSWANTTNRSSANQEYFMRRYGMVTRARPEKLEEYKKLHADAWPGVLRIIRQCNIRNYSIYLKRLPDGCDYLFSYFEYVGSDFETDMKKVAADPETQKWWAVCKPCLSPIDELPPGEVWSAAKEVFHQD